MRPGAIVQIRDWPGLWVVNDATLDQPPMIRCVREEYGLRMGRAAGLGDVTVIAEPIFSVGQRLTYGGREAEVVGIGNEVVRVTYRAPRDLDGGGRIDFGARFSNASRADLVLDNLQKFLE